MTESELKQAAIDTLHTALTQNRKVSRVKRELALEILQEIRESIRYRQTPEWMQQWLVENAAEDERERRNKWRD